jgi:hypothetical protein
MDVLGDMTAQIPWETADELWKAMRMLKLEVHCFFYVKLRFSVSTVPAQCEMGAAQTTPLRPSPAHSTQSHRQSLSIATAMTPYLPNELVEICLSYLDPNDKPLCAAVCLTSKFTRQIAEPLLYSALGEFSSTTSSPLGTLRH